ncbi:MAG: hypothetical protein WAP35_07485 [Solirubrobacterales bacterium]
MIKGRDIVVLICLATRDGQNWTIRSLADELGLAPAGVQRSIKNLLLAGLMFKSHRYGESPWVARDRAASFLIHAVRPYFPPVFLGDGVRGVAAASDAPPLRALLTPGDGAQPPLVWPYALGDQLGTAIQPLHESVPYIALSHHRPGGAGELLALVEAIRYVPNARIQTMAAELIIRQLTAESDSSHERRSA